MKRYILVLVASICFLSSCSKEDQDTLKIHFDGKDYKAHVYKLRTSQERPEYKPVTDQNGKQVYAEPLELIESKGQSNFSRPANSGDTYMIDIQKAKFTSLNVNAYVNEAEIKSWTIDQDTNRDIVYLKIQ